jgi:hypothetical protein
MRRFSYNPCDMNCDDDAGMDEDEYNLVSTSPPLTLYSVLFVI